MSEILKRENIDEKYKWKLNDIFSSENEWKIAIGKIDRNIDILSSYQGKLGESALNLLSFLETKTETSLLYEQVMVYARMHEDENTKDSKRQSMVQQLSPLGLKYSTNLSFFRNELLSIEENKMLAFYEQAEGLSFYKPYLDEVFRYKEHTLSPEKEEVLAQTGLLYSADDTFRKLNNADMVFESITNDEGQKLPLTNGTYATYLNSPNRAIRKQAFEHVYKSYDQLKNTIASTMLGNIKKDVFYSKIRNYPSSLESALFDDNVSLEVYENLISTVRNNTTPMHKYIELRKKMLGLEELHMYDMYVPLMDGFDKEISYEEAYGTMTKALGVLGEDYVSLLNEAKVNGWIDVYETDGKRSGAYSWGPYGTHPYVLLNHKNNMDSMFTLAHEMGHALHSAYSDKNLPYIYAGYSIFVAEVASTVNEVLLMRYLLDHSEDKAMKIHLINEFLDKFKSTLYRQTQFAEFEKITHEKVENDEPLTGEDLNDIYLQLNRDYYGDGVIHDEQIRLEWSRIPHFYNAFYVYQYATGFSAAIAIAERILTEGQVAVDQYKQFLGSGGSDYPIELLKIAGVDMSTPQPIEDALRYFSNLVDELESLTK